MLPLNDIYDEITLKSVVFEVTSRCKYGNTSTDSPQHKQLRS